MQSHAAGGLRTRGAFTSAAATGSGGCRPAHAVQLFPNRSHSRRGRGLQTAIVARKVDTVTTDDLKKARTITALKTPYLRNGKFDLPAFDRIVQHQVGCHRR